MCSVPKTNIIFIPRYGFAAAAVTSVLSEMFILVLTYLTAKKYLQFSINWLSLFKIGISAAVMGGIIILLQPLTYAYIENWNVLLLVPLGMIIYAAMLFITKTVDKKMLRLLRKGEAVVHD